MLQWPTSTPRISATNRWTVLVPFLALIRLSDLRILSLQCVAGLHATGADQRKALHDTTGMTRKLDILFPSDGRRTEHSGDTREEESKGAWILS